MTTTLRNWQPAILLALAAAAPSLAEKPAENKAPGMDTFAKLPLAFEANQGQTDSRAAFMAHGIAYSVFLTKQEAVLALSEPDGRKNVLRMGLAAANPDPVVSGLERLSGQSNYLIGNDPTKWRTGIPSFGRVRYEGVYPGIDLVYYGNRGELEYDFVLAPGSDPSRIRLRFAGARHLRVAENGDLIMTAGSEEVRFRKPDIYQTFAAGARTSVNGRFVVRGASEAGFQVAAYDHSRTLVIDPAIVRSTYLGGKGKDLGYSIAVDAQDAVYVTGSTTSAAGFPLPGCFDCALGGPMDAFVTKFVPGGAGFFYSTYLGGAGSDAGFGIAADANGNAYVTGETDSKNFPVVGAVFPVFGGGTWDAFVTALNPGAFPFTLPTWEATTRISGTASRSMRRVTPWSPAALILRIGRCWAVSSAPCKAAPTLSSLASRPSAVCASPPISEARATTSATEFLWMPTRRSASPVRPPLTIFRCSVARSASIMEAAMPLPAPSFSLVPRWF